ncbi:hypothetical protein [Streptomyces sp. NPDC001675]
MSAELAYAYGGTPRMTAFVMPAHGPDASNPFASDGYWLPGTCQTAGAPESPLRCEARRGVLRQTGAVYRFRHVRLQHHLARTYRERQARFSPVLLAGGAAPRRAPEPEGTRARP